MGRPALHMIVTEVRFPAELLARIDELVGDKHRAKFIRAAVEGALHSAELVKHPASAKGKRPA